MDYFDRQERIPKWNQNLISKQTCLCLGAGGLGTSVIIGLSRLGVSKIHIVDFDTIEIHNLNRQILFSKDSVSNLKADSARDAALNQHNLVSEILSYNFDVLKNWPLLVKLALDSDVIFNMIDIGDQFDMLLQSLCLTLKIPLIQGGTFRTSLNLDTFGRIGNPCLLCANPSSNTEFLSKIKPGETILNLKDLSFILHDEHPVGASAVFVSVIAGQLMVSNWLNLIFYEDEQNKVLDINQKDRIHPPTRVIMYLDNLEIVKFFVEPVIECLLCKKSTN